LARLDDPESAWLYRTCSDAFALGLFWILVLFALRVVDLVFAAEAPPVHEDLAVTAGTLRHQTPLEGCRARRPQVAITPSPAKPSASELQHAEDVAVEAFARLGLGDLKSQVSQLALDMQYGSKVDSADMVIVYRLVLTKLSR
jgi:hypothetical protein